MNGHVPEDKKPPAPTHTTPADGNIFADLGFEPDEAEKLLKEAQEKIEKESKE